MVVKRFFLLFTLLIILVSCGDKSDEDRNREIRYCTDNYQSDESFKDCLEAFNLDTN